MRARAAAAHCDEEDRKLAARLLFLHDASASWDVLSLLLEREPNLAESVLLRVAHETVTQGSSISQLDEPRLADLYIWLATRFPESEDPRHTGAYTPTLRDDVGELRNRVIDYLTSKGTHEAVTELERVRQVSRIRHG